MGFRHSGNVRTFAASAAVMLYHAMGQGYPTTADVADSLGVSKSSARRYLHAAQAEGMVQMARRERGSQWVAVWYPIGPWQEYIEVVKGYKLWAL